MTTYCGDDGLIRIGTTAIGETTGWTVSEAANQLKDTVQGDANETAKAGKKRVTGTITGYYDHTDATQNQVQVGSVLGLQLYHAGLGSGLSIWAVDATILTLDTSSEVDAIVPFSATWEAAGPLTKGVQP